MGRTRKSGLFKSCNKRAKSFTGPCCLSLSLQANRVRYQDILRSHNISLFCTSAPRTEKYNWCLRAHFLIVVIYVCLPCMCVCLSPFSTLAGPGRTQISFLIFYCFFLYTFKPLDDPYMVGTGIVTKEVKLNGFQFWLFALDGAVRQGQCKGM